MLAFEEEEGLNLKILKVSNEALEFTITQSINWGLRKRFSVKMKSFKISFITLGWRQRSTWILLFFFMLLGLTFLKTS